MKIRYVHCSNPGISKVMDSRRHYLMSRNFQRSIGIKENGTQAEYDNWLLTKLACDLDRGIILTYEIVEG